MPEIRTSRAGQAWRQVIDEDGKTRQFVCPRCGTVIDYDSRNFVGCDNCAWAPSMMSPEERADLEARDPEMIAVLEYLKKAEAWAPRFEGHENKKKISGKERQKKRFFSKISY